MNLITQCSALHLLKCSVRSVLLLSLLLSLALAETDNPLINYYKTPLQAVFTENAFAEHQELTTINLTQVLDRTENPSQVTITLTQSGFLDDSIQGTQEIYTLKLTEKGWIIDHKEMLIKCYRGPNTTEYLEQICL